MLRFELQEVGRRDAQTSGQTLIWHQGKPINGAAHSLCAEEGGQPSVVTSCSTQLLDEALPLIRRDARIMLARMLDERTEDDYLVA